MEVTTQQANRDSNAHPPIGLGGRSIDRSVRLLLVDDSEADAELLLNAFHRGGYRVTYALVDTRTAMRAELQLFKWDVITSDISMPQFNASDALTLAKELCPDVPFIVVSGEIDLNMAVALTNGGAQDQVHKRELTRLVPSIERAWRAVETPNLRTLGAR